MPKYTIKTIKLIGFAAETKKPGDTEVKVRIKCELITSDQPIFHTYMNHISSLFFSAIKYPIFSIYKFLIVLHADDTADIYINDFQEEALVRIKKAVKAGEKVFLSNISDISGLKFPEIDINSNDAVVYGLRTDWRYSLYYNFERRMDLEVLAQELGELKKEAAFYNLYLSTDAQIARSEIDSADALILTEGKSDWKHLLISAKKLGIRNKLTFLSDEDCRGSDDLYKMCEHYARLPQSTTMIFVFDRDEDPILKRLREKEKAGAKHQNWGNNVYSLYLPVPSGRSEDSHAITIEFFYNDGEITRNDKNGRRLFLSNEFNDKTGNHVSGDLSCVLLNMLRRNKISIVDSGVYDRENNSVALSKDDFADAVLNQKDNFDDFDHSSFKQIFDIIDNIIDLKKE